MGPTGNVLMIDANQVWDIQQAIEYVRRLGEIRPWFIEEPTAPDEYVLPLYLSAAFVPFFLPTAIALRHLRVANSVLGRACVGREFNRAALVLLLANTHITGWCSSSSSRQMQSMSFRLTHVVSPVSVRSSFSALRLPSLYPHAGGVGLCKCAIHLR